MTDEQPEIVRDERGEILRIAYRGMVLEYDELASAGDWGDDVWHLTIGGRTFDLQSVGHDGSGLIVTEATNVG